MPRNPSNKKFIGPRLENGLKSHPLQKIIKENCPKSKIERWVRIGNRPKWILEWEKYNSVQLHQTISNWITNHPEELGEFQRLLNQRELDRQKAQARASGDLRRLRILENGSEPYSVTQVLLKYGKDCHICLTPIDLKASRRIGVGEWFLGLHIDHLVAIANGGADTLSNVRPSHAICNLKKGSKTWD